MVAPGARGTRQMASNHGFRRRPRQRWAWPFGILRPAGLQNPSSIRPFWHNPRVLRLKMSAASFEQSDNLPYASHELHWMQGCLELPLHTVQRRPYRSNGMELAPTTTPMEWALENLISDVHMAQRTCAQLLCAVLFIASRGCGRIWPFVPFAVGSSTLAGGSFSGAGSSSRRAGQRRHS